MGSGIKNPLRTAQEKTVKSESEPGFGNFKCDVTELDDGDQEVHFETEYVTVKTECKLDFGAIEKLIATVSKELPYAESCDTLKKKLKGMLIDSGILSLGFVKKR